MADFVLTNDIGIVVEEEDLKDIDIKIKENINKYNTYVDNIDNYRNNNNMRHAAITLIDHIGESKD